MNILNYPSAGDYITEISNQELSESNSGVRQTIVLRNLLPEAIVDYLNSNDEVYASIGCRKQGIKEYIMFVKNSYITNSPQGITIQVYRGKSPYSSGMGGKGLYHRGNILIDFGDIPPFAMKSIFQSSISAQKANKYATTSSEGVVKLAELRNSISNPNPKVLNADNTLILRVFGAILNLSSSGSTLPPELMFDGTVSTVSAQRIQKMSQLFDTFFDDSTAGNSRLSQFITRYISTNGNF
jgi:hypothetical protein